MSRGTCLFLLFGLLLTTSCRDSEPPLSPKEPSAALRAALQGPSPYELPPGARSRWDAPWWTMSDEELADSIEVYGGRVFIGFKEPGARAGVDDWGRVLVTDATAAAGKGHLRSLGLTLEREFVLSPTVVTTIKRTLVPKIRAHPLVDYVEPVGRIEFEAQDTTWNVHRVRAPASWPSSTGSGVKLLVIDGGVPNDHPDLSPAVIQACDGSNGLDVAGHGTHVAGIAAAVDNAAHVIGVSHGVALWSSKVDYTSDQVRCAIEFGRINNVSVINMSFSTTETAALTDEIKGAYADGIFMAKSAGNTNGGPVTYPGTLFETVAVTSLDINNNRAASAAVAPEVELAAPGVSIESTTLTTGSLCTQGGLTGLCSGTSMAAPHVAAAAAILKSFNPTWTNVEIRDRLQKTAIDLGAAGRDNAFGFGLIDIRAALDFVPPLTVTIGGPTYVFANQTETWTASVSGGTTPYTFQWYVNSSPAGSNQSLTMNTGDSDFQLLVTVTDAVNANKSAGMSVTVNSCPPPQIICDP